jgi:hypothetical protein
MSTSALEKFSDLITNMAPNQPRDKNGRWSKTNSGTYYAPTSGGSSASFKLNDPVGLVAYFQTKSKTKITPMNLKKLEALNPQGLNSGKVVVPQGNKELAELAKRIMPPGTQIKSKYINNEHVKDYEIKKAAQTQPSTTTPTQPTPTPVTTPATTPSPVSGKGTGLRPLVPIDYSELTHVGPAPGGSTGATIAKDTSGKKYIIKKPNPNLPDPEGFITNEINANRIYRAAGVAVPHSGPVYLANGTSGMRSQFLEGGQTYKDWSQGKSQTEKDAMRNQIAKNFVLDALLGNHDVIGQNFDNIMVHNGKPIRIDNGGALGFRAQGQPKVLADTVEELKTMRDPSVNPQSHKMFKYITDADIQNQIKDLVLKKNDILSAVPPSQFNKMMKRFEHLESIVKQPASVSTTTPLPIHTGTTNPQVSIPLSSTLPTNLPYGGAGKIGNHPTKPTLQVVPAWALIEKGGKHTYKIETPEPTKEIGAWVAKLSPQESSSIRAYTGSSYGPMRDAVAAGDLHKKAGSGTVGDFINAVNKAPGLDKPSTVYRGIYEKSPNDPFIAETIKSIKEAGVGKIITENAHQSLTRDPSVAFTGGTSESVFFQIVSKTAKHIHHPSVHSVYGEQELLGLPGVQYRITKIIENPEELNGKTNTSYTKIPRLVVHLEEI